MGFVDTVYRLFTGDTRAERKYRTWHIKRASDMESRRADIASMVQIYRLHRHATDRTIGNMQARVIRMSNRTVMNDDSYTTSDAGLLPVPVKYKGVHTNLNRAYEALLRAYEGLLLHLETHQVNDLTLASRELAHAEVLLSSTLDFRRKTGI